MKTRTAIRSQDEINAIAMDVLERELGIVGRFRFLRQFLPLEGDYTAERQARPEESSLEELMASVRKQPIPEQFRS